MGTPRYEEDLHARGLLLSNHSCLSECLSQLRERLSICQSGYLNRSSRNLFIRGLFESMVRLQRRAPECILKIGLEHCGVWLILILCCLRALPKCRDGYGRIPRNGHFGLDKDKDWDRVICARVPSNSLEMPSKLAGNLLPHGCLICDKILKPNVDWVFEKDDLKDFYPSCATSYEQALTTPIGPAMPASFLEGTAALAEARAREKEKGRDNSGRRHDNWQPCAKSLPMGHLRAVEWAQLGHSNFLRAHGGLLDHEVLLYKASTPRASSWDGVMIDDRVTMREAPRGTRLGESQQAAAAAAAYPRFGL